MADQQETVGQDADRRRFLQKLGGMGLAVGASPLLLSCGGGSSGSGSAPASAPASELRTYYLSLPNAQPGAQYVVEAGNQQHLLVAATAVHLETARRESLGAPIESITHVAEAMVLPGNSPQLCYVKGRLPGGAGQWHLHSMFMHVPTAGVEGARCLQQTQCNQKAALLRSSVITGALRAELRAAPNVCAQYPAYKDFFDHAAALIMTHPELLSFDSATMAYIQQNIICTNLNTLNLAVSLYKQGNSTIAASPDVQTALAAATTGWAVLVPVLDPTTKVQLVDPGTGDLIYHTVYSKQTMQLLGLAIQSVLPYVKDDPNLGANITNLPDNTRNDGVQGKLWVVRNGGTTASGNVPLSVSPRRALAAAIGTLSFVLKDIEANAGYSLSHIATSGRTITFSVENWYARYLGMYARFLDGNGQPIPLSALDSDAMQQFRIPALNGATDAYMGLVNQETLVFGIPVKTATQQFSLTLPSQAASVLLLAGGLGTGRKLYPETITPGMVMTVVLSIALPSLFLIYGAASGIAALSESLSTAGEMLGQVAQLFITAMTDAGLVGSFGEPRTFMNLLPAIGTLLLKMLASAASAELAALGAMIKTALGIGESTSKFPLVGAILLAVSSLALVAQLAETSAEVHHSDWTFERRVVATHDLTVTVNCDPSNVTGFPQTAIAYQLTASCDKSTQRVSGMLPLASPNVKSLTYTFPGLPSGGTVDITAVFASSAGWVAGAGTTGSIDNTQDQASITITENLVPLTKKTTYSHKQKTVLDASGNRVWQATTVKPASPEFDCSNTSGSLCELVGLSLSEPAGSLGYTWRASSSSVTEFKTGANGQLYQFANIAFTADPQSGYMSSGAGLSQRTQLVYERASNTGTGFYVDSSSGVNLVRQVHLGAPGVAPTFDAPGSNLAVGVFTYPSDALLIHPSGALVSFNAAASKMEVLTPATTPGADAAAATATLLSGPGSRDGLLSGPVCAAICMGNILVIEQGKGRIQAFDKGGNPVNAFAGNTSPFIALQQRTSVTYLDIAGENSGYVYVLVRDGDLGVFAMDIYTPDGAYLSTTNDVRASKFALDLFRNAYMLNTEQLVKAGSVEPSVSQWIPST